MRGLWLLMFFCCFCATITQQLQNHIEHKRKDTTIFAKLQELNVKCYEGKEIQTRQAPKVLTGKRQNQAYPTAWYFAVAGGRGPDEGRHSVQHTTIPHTPDAGWGTTPSARGNKRVGKNCKQKQETTWTNKVKCCCRRRTWCLASEYPARRHGYVAAESS